MLKLETYLGNRIEAQQIGKEIYCLIFFSNGKIINLGQCNNGSNFVAINQAINQAKEFIKWHTIKNN